MLIQIFILELIVSQDLKDLSSREADIAIRVTSQPPDYLIGKKLVSICEGIYANQHYLAQTKNNHVLILWRDEDRLPSWAQRYFPESKKILRVDDFSSMHAAVKAGLGVAKMPCYSSDMLMDKSIKRLNLSLTSSNIGLWVLHHSDLKQTKRIQVCKEFLISTLLEHRTFFKGEQSLFHTAK